MHAQSVDAATLRTVIRRAPQRHGIVPCPHTATGLHVLETLRAEGDARPWAVVATAHPAKFEVVIEPLVGRALALPPSLAECLSRSTAATFLRPGYDILRACRSAESRVGEECVRMCKYSGAPVII